MRPTTWAWLSMVCMGAMVGWTCAAAIYAPAHPWAALLVSEVLLVLWVAFLLLSLRKPRP